MKTTEEVFSDMLDAVAVALVARGDGKGGVESEGEYRRMVDAHALDSVRNFFVPFIADVARRAVT